MHSSLKLSAVLGLAALAAAPVHAQNLVRDGGFEQADPSPSGYNLATPFDTTWIVIQGEVGFVSTNPLGCFGSPTPSTTAATVCT